MKISKQSVINPSKILKALQTYSPESQRYLLESFLPAQIFFCSTQLGTIWGSHHIVSFDKLISHREDLLFTTYNLYFKRKNQTVAQHVYTGSSIRPNQRILTHCYEIRVNPQKWGLCFSDLDDIIIDYSISAGCTYDKTKREQAEANLVSLMKPLLMKADGTDAMVEPQERRRKLKEAGIIN